MVLYENLDFQLNSPCALAIGKFEGLHIGHQAVIAKLTEMKRQGYLVAVLTFYPGPDRFFAPDKKEVLLLSEEEKEDMLEKLGVDVLVRIPFDETIAQMSAEAFLKDILIGKAKAACIVAGSDVAFGKGCGGNAAFLKKHEETYGYKTFILDKKELGGDEVSSSRIRAYLSEGKIEEANELLGYSFHLDGKVEKGHQFGRVMGFPTCNITLGDGKFLPPFGVYYTHVCVGDRQYEAMTNVGVRPTVSDSGRISVESFILDFQGNLYGEKLKVEFLHYSRTEKRFESPEELTEQLKRDEEEAKAFFRELKIWEQNKTELLFW